MSKLNVLIAGSTGYIGIQLIKLLVKHPNVNIKYICGNSSVGKSITVYEKSLKKFKLPRIVKFNKKLIDQIDIVFTALPNGEAQIISKVLNKKTVLIDLAADFRLEKASEYLKWYKLKHKAIHNIKKSIYALPEITGNKVKDFSIIACPGCYPTSIILPLLPLIKKNLIKSNNIIIDSKSGFSGAGRSVHKKYRNKNLYESLSVYGISSHRHNSEIEQILKKYTSKDLEFTFTPHLTPMFRGILSTIYVDLNKSSSISKLNYELKRFYKNHPFVKVKDQNTMLSTNDVIGSNNCFISVCKTKEKNKAIIISVIDNLIKGGAGQAVQNLNIKYNFPISRGLL
ncbi:N-acetyl-gamma-glutamyl-phosphate reductase [Candidatus Pelagibacter sp.]|uniref:N-acetyl-gamma-glutamyl-phosphate reductase n=1 Tax=Candidatus Pelagibacter sp. TaxID=2024849 RepID=UPI003F8799B9